MAGYELMAMRSAHNDHLQANDGAMANCPACREMNADRMNAADAPASPDRLGEAQRLADGENAYAMPRAQALALIDIAESLRDIRDQLGVAK